ANGFYLDFSNSGAIGTDASGQGNHWTVSGSVSQITSTPTNIVATFDPKHPYIGTLSNGNRTCVSNDATNLNAQSTLIASFPVYVEFVYTTLGTNPTPGIVAVPYMADDLVGGRAESWGWHLNNGGEVYHNGSTANTLPSALSAGTRGCLAFDPINGKLWTGQISGNTIAWDNSGDPDAGTGAVAAGIDTTRDWLIAFGGRSSIAATAYFAEDEWIGVTNRPTTFLSLCTDNLPAVMDSIDNHFKTVLDTGANIKTTAEAQFTDYLAWIKDRSNANNHQLFDTLRGTTAILQSNTTAAETTYSAPAGNSVAWCWNLPSSETNTSGTISVIWKYNATLGMAVGTFTGGSLGGSDTLGIPAAMAALGNCGMTIAKDRDTNTYNSNWLIWHKDLTSTSHHLYFTTATQTDAGATSYGGGWYYDVASGFLKPQAGTSNAVTPNESGDRYVIYCFWETPFCKIGKYTNNGNAEGPFLNCGVSPVWGLFKTDASASWCIYDDARPGYNPVSKYLLADTSGSEGTSGHDVDLVSTGVKMRTADVPNAGSSSTFYVIIGQPQGPAEVTAR
ncbi:MAG: hypothetical protein HQL35_11535, partial [Alphaproteobacteria bacterium]|nr:hypothetical protein [Alphaproteobacteria bacterium]